MEPELTKEKKCGRCGYEGRDMEDEDAGLVTDLIATCRLKKLYQQKQLDDEAVARKHWPREERSVALNVYDYDVYRTASLMHALMKEGGGEFNVTNTSNERVVVSWELRGACRSLIHTPVSSSGTVETEKNKKRRMDCDSSLMTVTAAQLTLAIWRWWTRVKQMDRR